MTATKFKLSTPIKAFGNEVTELEIKEPSGGTIRRCGYPFKYETTRAGARVQIIDAESMANYIKELCTLTIGAVDGLNPDDFLSISGLVMSFFGAKTQETSPLDTMT
jgi:hypothetical protein